LVLTVQRLEGLSVVKLLAQRVELWRKLSQNIELQLTRPEVLASCTTTSLVASDAASTEILTNFSGRNQVGVGGSLGEGATIAGHDRHEARSQQKPAR
jgi:hypothetical protein